MRVIDISVAVSPDTPPWPGDTPFSCGWTWAMTAGASVNVSSVTMSPHVGTHADAPVHVQVGAAGAAEMPLEPFHGEALVVDISDLDGAVSLETIVSRLPDAPTAAAHTARTGGDVFPARLLLRTGRTIAGGTFPERWPFLSVACAGALVARGVTLVGVDCPSVDERESKTLDVHHALFGGGAFVLENLVLDGVAPGRYELAAYPTKFVGLDAAPVRAVLIEHP